MAVRWETPSIPAAPVSVARLHMAARIIRDVAQHADRLDPTIRDELTHVSAGLDTLATRQREVERVLRGEGG